MTNDVLMEIATMVPVSFPDGTVLKWRDIFVGRVGHDIICCARKWLWENGAVEIRHFPREAPPVLSASMAFMEEGFVAVMPGVSSFYARGKTEEDCILAAIKKSVSASPAQEEAAPPAQASEPAKPLGMPPSHIMATMQDIAEIVEEQANFDNRIVELERRLVMLAQFTALDDTAKASNYVPMLVSDWTAKQEAKQ